MKFAQLCDGVTASALQIAWLQAQLEPVSEPGARAYAALAPFRPGEETQAQQCAAEIAQLAGEIGAARIDAMRDILRGAPDPLPAIVRAATGESLEDAQLLELLRFLDAAAKLAAHVRVDDAAQDLAHLLERGRCGQGFYLCDAFDPQLERVRLEADSAQTRFEHARGELAARVAQELGRDDSAEGEFIVMRDGMAVLPQGVRVVREAPTYYLCELELDEAALEALRERDRANGMLASIESAARARISHGIRAHAAMLERYVEAIGAFDMRLAQVRFAQRHGCVAPSVIDQAAITFINARYIPLQAELEAQGRAYEPIEIDLGDVAILTGPNMGGKSVALRTCGFIALLTAFGLPVPATRAECGLFDDISWLGIGAREELGGLLSAFAREVVRLQELLSRACGRPLMLIDEFARTTTPTEAKALLVALVRVLRRRGIMALIATHLAGVAEESGARHFAVRGLREIPQGVADGDLSAALSALAEAMDYAVAEVTDGEVSRADAIALAALLGLDRDVVAEASAALSKGMP